MNRQRGILVLVPCILGFPSALVSQTGSPAVGSTLTFTEASVRPAQANIDPAHRSIGLGTGGHFNAENATLRDLLKWAYDAQDFQVVDGPALVKASWIDTARFDIRTTTEGNVSLDTARNMLRSLLRDRFRLVLHPDTRKVAAYDLVVAKNDRQPSLSKDSDCATGDLMHASVPPAPGAPRLHYCGNLNFDRGLVNAEGVSMSRFAEALSIVSGRQVTDRTELPGLFDINLKFAPADAPADSDLPSLVTAVQEQLGLRLRSTKAPVNVFVVDSAAKPDAN